MQPEFSSPSSQRPKKQPSAKNNNGTTEKSSATAFSPSKGYGNCSNINSARRLFVEFRIAVYPRVAITALLVVKAIIRNRQWITAKVLVDGSLEEVHAQVVTKEELEEL